MPRWLYGLLLLVVAVPVVWWAVKRIPVQKSGDRTGRVAQIADDRVAPVRGALTITYPLDGTMFPPEIVPPTFCWEDTDSATNRWSLEVEFTATGAPGGGPVEGMQCVVDAAEWTPTDAQWEAIQRRSVDRPAKITVTGPDNVYAYRAWSLALSEQGRLNEAETLLRKAREIVPEDRYVVWRLVN